MKATSAANHASVLSLLEQGYSVRDIERRTGLGKSTVGRIKKEVDTGKENNLGGRPSKLSVRDKTSIIRQIQSGKLDTAVQATISSILLFYTLSTHKQSEGHFRRVVSGLLQRRKCPC
jgi:transposase